LFPETVTTIVTFKSIAEDLQDRTLRAVTGLLGKLGYLAGLREDDGSYMHWGLARIHGDAATQRALTEAHQGLVSRILRMPLRKLLQDVEDSSGSKETEKAAFLDKLNEQSAQLLPPAPGAGTARHLNSVLLALAGLVKNRS
jgi:hypothetical protein